MGKQQLQSASAGPPLGAYSQGVRAGDFVFITGTMAIDAATSKVVGATVAEQTAKILENISHVLAEAGTDFSTVVKANVYLTDTSTFQEFNEVYARTVPSPYPVRTTIGVDMGQVPGALVEIDMIAYLG